MELDQLLEVFKFLASPFDDRSSSSRGEGDTVINSPQAVFQNITDFCLKHQVDFLESSKSLLFNGDTPPTSSWKFTCLILSLLDKLKTTVEAVEAQQTEEEKAIDVLSIQAQLLVQKSVELVIGFGVMPYLLPGLGVPPKLRKMNPSVSHFLLEARSLPPFDQFLRLAHTLEILLQCSQHPTLNTLIAQKYTSDILAGLLQVCKSPILPPNPSKPGALSVEEYSNVMNIRKKLCVQMTDNFFPSVPKGVLINSLFLIGAAEKPRWISGSCNDLLFDMILSKNGLVVVASTMVEVSGSCDTWKLMRIISRLMKSAVVKQDKSLIPEKMQCLAEQCYQMVTQNLEESSGEKVKTDDCVNKNVSQKLPYGENLELMQIGFFCGITLMDIDFSFGKSIFWDKLFRPVLHLDTCQKQEEKTRVEKLATVTIIPGNGLLEPCEKGISSSLQNVTLCAVYAEHLLGLLKPMNSSLPLKQLQPVWSLFVQIFVACERYLAKPVQEPALAAAAEQLHHKLKDVLLLLFEIYGSGAGENLVLPSSGNGNVKPTEATTTTSGTTSNLGASNSKINAGEGGEPAKEVNLCDFIMMLLLNQEADGVPTLNTFDLAFDFDSQAEVRIVQTHQELISGSSDYNKVYETYLDQTCVCLSSEVLKNERLKGIWPTLFRQLLEWGTTRHARSSGGGREGVARPKSFKSDELPTRLDGNGVKVSLSECQKFITFKILGEMGDEEKILEQFGNSESLEETLGFVELLLNKFTEEVCNSSDLTSEEFDTSQLIMYALGIIGALIDTALASVEALSAQFPTAASSNNPPLEINKEINQLWDSLQIFIPHLRKLSQCTQASLTRQGIPEMASGLLYSIGSRGLDRKAKTKFPLKTRFQQALEDASSPMVHVRGHGILELRRLVEQRDGETLENEVQVLKIFRENLDNDDSYVYLMSIQGMAALAVKFHKTVVPLLIKEYDFANCDDDDDDVLASDEGCGNNEQRNKSSSRAKMYQQMDRSERIETRMKVGEILVKVVQKLNELAPSYRAPLTNVFFRMMRDEEPFMRASALANLGELCHLLKFSLGIILTEVWFCVESILSTEKDVHVRRAALHLLVLLLKGVQKDLTAKDILSDTTLSQHLRDARRLLTRIEQCEKDLVAKTHCQLALQELELIVKKLLTPSSSSLSYKIQILDL